MLKDDNFKDTKIDTSQSLINMTDWSVILSMPFTLHRRKKGHHFSTTSTTRYNTLLVASLGYASRPSDTKKRRRRN
jgi:hypothetical protein